jgi:vancomycin resistance protein VanW
VFPDINRSIPFACGATLSYNYVDLQLRNSTQQDFVIEVWLDKSHLNGRLTSNLPSDCTYQVIETDHQIQQQWWGGYTRHNRIWKESTHKDSGEQKMDLVTENNAIMMYNPLLEGSKG